MLLSIITINLNNSAGLEKTLASVAGQTFREFEYIVIDGESSDGSVEIIDRFAQSFSDIPFRWISESDTGIYNAMNKGIQMARGEYMHFLNSGDWLVDDAVVENMLRLLAESTDILVGNVISVRKDGKVRYNKNRKAVSLLTFYSGTIQHTSAYIKKSLFDRYGLYDESLRIVSDWKWYLQVAGLNKANVKFTDTYVTFFDTTGISSINLELDKAERRKVLEELIPAPILADYDKYHFDIIQVQRLKRYSILYKIFWLVERSLFKVDKWREKYFSWKR